MTNTIVFFIALLLTYMQLDMWFNNKSTKGEISGAMAVAFWSFLYYLTHTN